MESMETAAISAMTSTAAAAAAAEAGAGADDPALDALVDMGFARDRARAALDAAGGGHRGRRRRAVARVDARRRETTRERVFHFFVKLQRSYQTSVAQSEFR